MSTKPHSITPFSGPPDSGLLARFFYRAARGSDAGRRDRPRDVVTQGAVEKHISNIFAKLDLPAGDDDHSRVPALLAYLRDRSAVS